MKRDIIESIIMLTCMYIIARECYYLGYIIGKTAPQKVSRRGVVIEFPKKPPPPEPEPRGENI